MTIIDRYPSVDTAWVYFYNGEDIGLRIINIASADYKNIFKMCSLLNFGINDFPIFDKGPHDDFFEILTKRGTYGRN